jgi:hypothetical protein
VRIGDGSHDVQARDGARLLTPNAFVYSADFFCRDGRNKSALSQFFRA